MSPGGPDLVPLPSQPDGVPWPTTAWAEAPPPPDVEGALDGLLDAVCDDDGPLARTHAVVVVHRGAVVAERYQGQLEHFDRPPAPVTPQTRLLSWSMAKSMLHAVVGLLVGDGLLDLDGPTAVPEWSDPTTRGTPSPCATCWPCATGSTSSRTTSTSASPM
jgi:CubicO group peptidase (beta-lactamase class C family)